MVIDQLFVLGYDHASTCAQADGDCLWRASGGAGARICPFPNTTKYGFRVLRGTGPKQHHRGNQGPCRNWSAEHAEHEVARCIEVLSRDVQQSRTVLQVTFPAHSSSWKRSVRLALLDHKGSPNILESGVSATSGVPNGLRVLREMVHAIDEMENEENREEIDFEVSRVSSMRRVHPMGSRDRSGSAEYIQISNVSAWGETAESSLPDMLLRETRGMALPVTITQPDVLRACSDPDEEHSYRPASDASEGQLSDNAFMLSGNFMEVRSLQSFAKHRP
jgi:hypothetical protein